MSKLVKQLCLLTIYSRRQFKCNSSNLLSVNHRSISTTLVLMSKNSKKNKQQQQNAAAAQPTLNPLNDSNNALYVNKNGQICINFLCKPGANETSVCDVQKSEIGIKIAAPPVDGEANKELLKYISRLLKLKSADVSLDTGAKNRNKTIVLHNCSLTIENIIDIFKNET